MDDAALQHRQVAPATIVTPTAEIAVDRHGDRAKCLQRLIRLGLPVPKTAALSFEAVRGLAAGRPAHAETILDAMESPLLSVRPSSQNPDWGGPGAILNVGMTDARHRALARTLGPEAADALYLRFVQAYAVEVAHLDAELFDAAGPGALKDALAAYEEEAEEAFPQDPARQLADVLAAMARAWESTSARLLRQARGAPADAGLGLVVQAMALGVGPGISGSGVIQFVSSRTGAPQVTGRYLSQSQGREALRGGDALYLARDPRGPSLEEHAPEAFAALLAHGATCRSRLREEMEIEFALQDGALSVLDAARVARTSRAAVAIAVDLAEDGVIDADEALMRVPPRTLSDLLHRQVDPAGRRDVVARGIAASPGAAVGRLVFSSRAAQAAAAREEPCILIRSETTPEDVRGMHAALGVVTEKGGMTSHAAVIARGLGLPCIVGAAGLRIDRKSQSAVAEDGRHVAEGDIVTIDGTAGEVLAGAAPLLEPELGESFRTLLAWADARRDIGVRANADSAGEAEQALAFAAEGIGLCRTEHMFFQDGRLSVMREMIFAADTAARAAALERLLPMQRADFASLFRIMGGRPVSIRLLDPPLHEFLPSTPEGLRELAGALQLRLKDVTRRVEALREFNPMLGLRGVRLGVSVPEIYDMQARAIFEALIEAGGSGSAPVPEIMIPLVSAMREVEIVKARIAAVASAVRRETGARFDYRLGVMVETPRAALRAGEIARHASFLSFGTNDLTQMTYGLSRDDAGRFMGSYVSQGVYDEDPFHKLDVDGVGELLTIAAARARAAREDVALSLCGEHGGDVDSIDFCRAAGFDYVSCSPFRVPLARLAAARLAVADARAGR